MEHLIQPWLCWTLLAIVCAILEVTLPLFAFCFVSLAAVIAALVSLRAGMLTQVGAFALTLCVSIFLLRPRFLKRFQLQHKMPSRSEALVGLRGVVRVRIDEGTDSGRVDIEGHDWAARSHTAIEIGQSVIVQGHDGIVLLVKEI